MLPVKQRPYVKCLYVSKFVTRAGNRVQYDIALITVGDKYIEYEIVIRQKQLTFWVLQRLRQLFSNYRMDSHTDVVISDTMDQYDPMTMYLQAVSAWIGFMVHAVSFENIFSRICSRYYKILRNTNGEYSNPGPNANACVMRQKLWRGLVGKRVCPWITEEYDTKISRLSETKKYKKQMVRIGALYVLIKCCQREYDRNSNAKKQLL